MPQPVTNWFLHANERWIFHDNSSVFGQIEKFLNEWNPFKDLYINSKKTELEEISSLPRVYATPKVTKYQRCNFIIQVHQFTIKIDKININLLFECVKIVEFNFNSRVFYVMYQETRFLNQDACFLNQEGTRQFLITFVSARDWNRV